SDLLVIAGPDVDPEPVALDLLAQAEHGQGTLVVAIAPSRELLEAIAARIEPAPDTGAVTRLVQADGPDDWLQLAQAIAPEHLQLMGAEPERLAPQVTHAGCVF